MPISGGTAGAHDDAMHQGDAKRDVVDGVAGLDSHGDVLAVGSTVRLRKDLLDKIHLFNRTSSEYVQEWFRDGINHYSSKIQVAGVYKTVLNDSHRDAVNGIAGLDASGHLLIPSYRIYAARGASEQVTFRERTSDERMMRLIRNGADDYEGRINVAGTEQRILTMRDLCLEEYSNHLGAVDNYTQTGVTGNGTANTDAANHKMDLSTGVTVTGHARFEMKDSHAVGSASIVVNYLIQNIINGAGGTRRSTFGLANLFSGSMPSDNVSFLQKDDDTWVAITTIGGSSGESGISALSNGDLCTIKYVAGTALFFVNRVLVATRTTNLPTAALKGGAMVTAVATAATTARQLSVDMLSYRRYV